MVGLTKRDCLTLGTSSILTLTVNLHREIFLQEDTPRFYTPFPDKNERHATV